MRYMGDMTSVDFHPQLTFITMMLIMIVLSGAYLLYHFCFRNGAPLSCRQSVDREWDAHTDRLALRQLRAIQDGNNMPRKPSREHLEYEKL